MNIKTWACGEQSCHYHPEVEAPPGSIKPPGRKHFSPLLRGFSVLFEAWVLHGSQWQWEASDDGDKPGVTTAHLHKERVGRDQSPKAQAAVDIDGYLPAEKSFILLPSQGWLWCTPLGHISSRTGSPCTSPSVTKAGKVCSALKHSRGNKLKAQLTTSGRGNYPLLLRREDRLLWKKFFVKKRSQTAPKLWECRTTELPWGTAGWLLGRNLVNWSHSLWLGPVATWLLKTWRQRPTQLPIQGFFLCLVSAF